MIDNEQLLVRNSTIETAEMDGEIGMLNVETGNYFILNGIGADVWELLEQPKTFEQLIDALIAMYDVDRETCLAETMDFANDLLTNGLIIKR